MWEWIASAIDKISAFMPGKYTGIGISLLLIGITWKFSDAPYANWVALGTALLSLDAFVRSIGAPWAVGVVLSLWVSFLTAPAFFRAVSASFAIEDTNKCVASWSENTDQDPGNCKDSLKLWLKGN
ncbi:hypothetical protein [Donghicola sp. XS_ASV15]|uniref:hypothetical protein n=1 Tax=Donghicola sp. XS_ASV15 TaxID=3241295 RepID=UPI0035148D35